jgi:general L-amino acid transport system permease protein
MVSRPDNIDSLSTSEPPPALREGLPGWARRNLFNSWFNGLLTIISLAFVYWLARRLVNFLASSDWTVVTQNLALLAIGQYPRDQVWRVLASVGLVAVLWISTALVWGRSQRSQTVLVILWLLSPVIVAGLLSGLAGFELLPPVRTQLWSGLLLTIVLTVTGIVGSFPLGVLLALGRRSDLVILKWLSTIYVEVIRGVPLITILFMAQVMLPLFLNASVDVVIRAMIGIILFSAAYLAENIRGGLQAIPQGQVEAAQALGLNPVLVTALIVMPQAIRIVIPAIVGQFISLFKDTTLVSIVTLLDLLGIVGAAIAQNPVFAFHKTEAYLFLAAVYFVFSYVMSNAARRIETATRSMGGTRQL